MMQKNNILKSLGLGLIFCSFFSSITVCMAAKQTEKQQSPHTKETSNLSAQQEQDDSVHVTPRGIYVQSQHCHQDALPLHILLKNQLKIAKDQQLITLFEQMLCAPRDDDGNLNLGLFAKHIQNPIAVYMSTYMGMAKLGEWSLKDAHHLSDLPATEASISALGLFLGGSRQTVSFWQVHSPAHIRIWQAPFTQSPSDALIFEFKLINQEWTLMKLWMGSRI